MPMYPKLNKVACDTAESKFFIEILGHDDSARVTFELERDGICTIELC